MSASRKARNIEANPSVAVCIAVRRLPANPLFVLIFVGTGVASAASIVLSLVDTARSGAPAAVGGVLYLVGAIVVTGVANVPRNDAFDAADPASSDGADLWTRYLREWTAWNHVRTVATTAALALFVLASS